MIDVGRGRGATKPWWELWVDVSRRHVLFCCPFGHLGTLDDHVVLTDGTVMGPPGESGSVQCPEPGCTFHETVRLVSWSPSESP